MKLRVSSKKSYVVTAEVVDHLSVFGNWIGFGSARDSQDDNTVWVINRTTGAMRHVATSAWAGGQTDWVEGTGDWLFWTDQSFEPTDTTVPAWTLKGMNLLTGRMVELDHSDSWPSPTPIPRAANGYVVWYRAASKALAHTSETVWTFDPTTGKKEKVGTGLYGPMAPGKGFIAFARPVAGTPRTSMAEIDLSTGKIRDIVGASDAGNPRTADGSDLLVWLAPSVNDPTSVNWQVGPSGAQSSAPQEAPYSAVPGTDFIAFGGGLSGSVSVINAADPHDELTLTPNNAFVPCRVAASGNTVAWCEQQSPTQIAVRTADIDQ